MKKRFLAPDLLIAIGALSGMVFLRGQGNLTPPGPPGPLMKTLDQIEPRTLISLLPYTITNSGSYYLLTNLTGVAGQNGIIVRADHVTLDLNGFSLIGVVGSSSGVSSANNVLTNLVVRNGTIRNWGGHGVDASVVNNTRIERLIVSLNSGKGVVVSANGLIENSTTTGNGNIGVQAGPGSIVRSCLASQNGGNGILIGANGLTENCSATGNSGNGIQTGSGSTLKSCVVSQNGVAGILADTGNNLIDCTSQGNLYDGVNCGIESRLSGCVARGNGRYGISCGDLVHIDTCDAQRNQSTGLNSGAAVSIRASMVANNRGDGIIVGAASHVTDSQAISNSGIGINAGDGSTVSHCTVGGNGGDGIAVTSECKVIGNNAHSNTSIVFSSGIHATGTRNHIADNTTTSNDHGIRLDADGNFEVRNVSGNNSFNYFGSTNQIRGPILTTLDDPTTSSLPWANFDLSGVP